MNSVVGATIGRPPKNGLKSMKRAADDRPYKVFVIAKHPYKSKFEFSHREINIKFDLTTHDIGSFFSYFLFKESNR